MWPELPIEFNVTGTPVSLQGSAVAKSAWKAAVLSSAYRVLETDAWSLQTGRLAITLYYFPRTPMNGDLDNIIKPVLDALCPNVYLDDRMIDRIVVQRFGSLARRPIDDPSDLLAEAMVADAPVLYIRIDRLPEVDPQ